jgi:hypothetical protein
MGLKLHLKAKAMLGDRTFEKHNILMFNSQKEMECLDKAKNKTWASCNFATIKAKILNVFMQNKDLNYHSTKIDRTYY